MLSEYEIMRIADAVYQRIASDNTLIQRIGKALPKEDRYLNAKQVAVILGTSVYTIRRRAEELGGELQPNGRWLFRESKIKGRQH